MEAKIQNIIFPTTDELERNQNLFYHCAGGYLDRKENVYHIADRTTADFCTYINGCSYSKWKEYTDICGAKLNLTVSGRCKIRLVGYKLNIYSPVRTVLGEIDVDSVGTKQTVTAVYPDTDNIMIGFEVIALEDTAIYGGGGSYTGIYADDKKLRSVTLSLATTTCRKEEFIKSNVALIKEQILESKEDADIAANFYVQVVDNGRTLEPADIEGWHVKLHPNKNTGGSGGFARGMMESLWMNPQATNVLLMDDDVIVLPESIKRTYRLLTLVNDDYKDALISGAMLYMEEMNIQHEDIGTMRKENLMCALKGRLDHNFVQQSLMNESTYFGAPLQYAAWWYCCIPAGIIEKKGLPMPFFIRIDDTEYGIRANTKIMTMNGICIWHMGFTNKYNLTFDVYQHCRNTMIAKAIGTFPDDIDTYGHLRRYFVKCMTSFNYGGARLVLRALQDYLRGPDFIAQDLGEKLLKENTKLNEKYLPMDEFKGVEWRLYDLFWNPPRKPLDTLWYRVTWNGQRFWPVRWLKDDNRCIPFNDNYQPQKYVKARRFIAINPDTKMAAYREIDKKQYREIKREWHKAILKYKFENKKIKAAYREQMPYLTSMEFWKKYLEI